MPNGYNNHAWAGPKPGARSQKLHLGLSVWVAEGQVLGLSSAAPLGSWKGVGLEEEGQGLKLLLPRVMLALQVAG